MTSEAAIEKEIQDKGLNAPRLAPTHIDKVIVGETYTNLPNGRSVVCQLTLVNGYTVEGTSSCVSAENFNQEIGNKIAKENAREKIWELEGYLLKQRLHESLLEAIERAADKSAEDNILAELQETWTQHQIHDSNLVKKMKPEPWIIEDIRSLRSNKNRTAYEESYLSLLLSYTKMLQQKVKLN